jgi:hypothetical protein
MLHDLDENKVKYHIQSYGLSNSSLEQVFLRVADEIKRPEDYERLSRWKKLKIRIKQCFRRKEEVQEEETEQEQTEEEEESKDETNTEGNDSNDSELFNTGLSGKIKNRNP